MPWEAGAKMPVKPVKAYDPGCVHVESSICPTCRMRTIGSTALPRLTAPHPLGLRRTPPGQVSRLCRRFPHAPDRQGPFHDHQGPHYNGKEFTDRFCATGQRQPTGAHAFDRVCTANRSEHRLTKPRTPQTHGMIERLNGRIAEVLATTRFDSAEHLADTIKRYVKVYNQHIPQKALGHSPPPSGNEKLVPKTDPAVQKMYL